jgi:hypothetical protein
MYALQTTPIFWISNHGPQSINPISLEVIADITTKFLKQSKNPVILIDGIEHLIFENGSAPVLRLLRDIQEWIILQRAILILPVNPEAIEKKELALMERNMNELRQSSNDQ